MWALLLLILLAWLQRTSLTGRPVRPAGAPVPTLETVFFDVGHGDATLIRSGGEAALVDGGGVEAGPRLVAALRALGVEGLRAAVLTEAAPEHAGGMIAVLEALPVDLLVDGGLQPDPVTARLHEAAVRRRVAYQPGVAGDVLELGQARLRVLLPSPAQVEAGGRGRAGTLALLVEAAGVRLLLTGHLDTGGERTLLRMYPALRAHVLRVPAHGAADALSTPLLAQLQPVVAVIGVGRYNEEGLPDAATLARLTAQGTAVLRTDRDGTVRVLGGDGWLTVVPDYGPSLAFPLEPARRP